MGVLGSTGNGTMRDDNVWEKRERYAGGKNLIIQKNHTSHITA